MPDVRHDEVAHRFEVETEAGVAVLEYRLFSGGVDLAHTVVPEEAENQGTGSALARAALEWARGEGLRVEPSCRFVAAFLRRHPEYADVQRGPHA